MTTAAAMVFLALTGAAVLFQLALVAGAPWGTLTWGGRFPGVLPASMRLVAALIWLPVVVAMLASSLLVAIS